MSVRNSPEIRPDNDTGVLKSWHEWHVEDGRRKIILCVETSLELRPGHQGFEPEKLKALLSDAADLMRQSASPIDAFRIVPVH